MGHSFPQSAFSTTSFCGWCFFFPSGAQLFWTRKSELEIILGGGAHKAIEGRGFNQHISLLPNRCWGSRHFYKCSSSNTFLVAVPILVFDPDVCASTEFLLGRLKFPNHRLDILVRLDKT